MNIDAINEASVVCEEVAWHVRRGLSFVDIYNLVMSVQKHRVVCIAVHVKGEGRSEPIWTVSPIAMPKPHAPSHISDLPHVAQPHIGRPGHPPAPRSRHF